jgi:hypothetical protein
VGWDAVALRARGGVSSMKMIAETSAMAMAA